MLSFLDLPREIRDYVYELLLVKNTGFSPALDLTNVLHIHYRPHPNCSREPFLGSVQPTKWLFSSSRLFNIGSTTILRACKRIAEEGAQVLYGSSTINCIPGSAFHLAFLPTIGAFNSSCLRSIHLCLSTFFTAEMIHLANRQFQKQVHDTTNLLVNLLSRELSQLEQLTLGIPAASCHRLNLDVSLLSSNIWWIRAHCAMLWFPAWITARHGRLKRAVWSQRWISRCTPEHGEDVQYLDISIRITALYTRRASGKGHGFEELMWYVRQGMLNKGMPLQSIEDVLLDSRAIRQQGLDGLQIDHNPLSYTANEVSNTSEVRQARNVMEDISDRLGYTESEHDTTAGGR